jgi:ubiquinone biosynthesis monooxygenase Coq7
MRHYSFIDQICLRADRLLRMLSGNNVAESNARPVPAHASKPAVLTDKEHKHVAGLMRVNYTGEVCAQALYQGQALTIRNWAIKQQLEQAGLEEQDHLLWCQSRLKELNSHVSYLNPLWYAGSFLLGITAGLVGDRWNLGFLEETEKQVVQHLENHLQQLPEQDEKTRAILSQMLDEEKHHATAARNAGAVTLPKPIQFAMRFTAKMMTMTAYRI